MYIDLICGAAGITLGWLIGASLTRSGAFRKGFLEGEVHGRQHQPLLEHLLNGHPGGIRISKSWNKAFWFYRVTNQAGIEQASGSTLHEVIEEAARSAPGQLLVPPEHAGRMP